MPPPFDPQDYMDLLRYLTGTGTDRAQLLDSASHADVWNTNGRMLDQDFSPQTGVNAVGERAGDTAILDEYNNPLSKLTKLPGVRGGIGIGDIGSRLSGEGNLGLLLTSLAIDQMSRQGDPMAGYLRYLSGANAQQV